MKISDLTIEEIRAVMKDRSVYAMAEKSGVSVTVLYRVLKGSENFQCSTISKISSFLLKEYPESQWYLGELPE